MRSKPIIVLGGLAILLVILILAGTIYAFASGHFPGRGDSSREIEGGVFEGIGSIRAKTKDRETKIAAVSISCLYEASDIPFSDELKSKAPELRKTAVKYFSEKMGSDLNPAFEGRIKAELKDKLNSLLVLGKIEALYFTEFALIE